MSALSKAVEIADQFDAMWNFMQAEEPKRLTRSGWVRLRVSVDEFRAALEQEMAKMSDPTADTEGKVRASASAAERAAALAVMPKTGTVRSEVLVEIARSRHGLTQPELETLLDGRAAPSSVRTRCNELVTGGWVKDSGRTRHTRSGLEAKVWVLTDRAQVALDRRGTP